MKTKNPVEVNVRYEVLRGAAWLDQVRPGWDQEIDLTTLEMSNCARCIVGQLWGWADRLGTPKPAYYYHEDYGFDIPDEHLSIEGAYEKLAEEWRDLITSRRA